MTLEQALEEFKRLTMGCNLTGGQRAAVDNAFRGACESGVTAATERPGVNASLEPIFGADIPGANQLFVAEDTREKCPNCGRPMNYPGCQPMDRVLAEYDREPVPATEALGIRPGTAAQLYALDNPDRISD